MNAAHPTIAFLHLGQTHDDFPEVAAALSGIGIGSRLIHCEEVEAVDWGCYAAVNVRECRGYHLAPGFLARLERLHTSIAPLDFTNPLAVIRGTLEKATYLPVLEQAGIELVPTYCWSQEPAGLDLETLFDATGWNDVVAKPSVSSKSWNTFRASRIPGGVIIRASGEPAPRRLRSLREATELLRSALSGGAYCVQRYLPDIETRGETAFVFLGGEFSHAVRKMPAPGGWLAHEFYGGANAACAVTDRDRSSAEAIHSLLVQRYGGLSYARIDAIPDAGKLLLLECELIVPRLFLRQGGAVRRYAAVLAATCRGRSFRAAAEWP